MALYAIGDLHLSLGAPKPMDVFGGAWVGYMDKLEKGMSVIGPEDTTCCWGTFPGHWIWPEQKRILRGSTGFPGKRSC